MKTIELDTTNTNIDVSVIIPTYNRLPMLKEALDSIFDQDYQGRVQIIVVDDNSSDGTSKIISDKYPEVDLISLKENSGPYVARNRGLKEAKGKYIAFLDSDDLWKPEYLATQISALEGRERSFCVSTVLLWDTVRDEKTVKLQKYDLERFISPIHQLFVKSSFIMSPSSVMFPREVFQEIGLFDENYRVGADRGIYVSCLVQGYKMLFIDQPLVTIRKHNQGQLTDFNAEKIEQRKQSRILYLERLYPLVEKHQLVCPSIDRLYAEIYSTAAREFFRSRCYGLWIKHWVKVAKHTSLFYAIFNIIRDLLRFSKKYLPNSFLNVIRKRFLSKTLST